MPHPVRCPIFFFRKINLYVKTKKSTHGHTTPRPFDLPFWLLVAKKHPTTRHHHPHHRKNACTTQNQPPCTACTQKNACTTQIRLPCTACTQKKLRAPPKIVYPAPSTRLSRAACKSNYRTSPPLRGKRMHHIKSSTRHYMQCIFSAHTTQNQPHTMSYPAPRTQMNRARRVRVITRYLPETDLLPYTYPTLTATLHLPDTHRSFSATLHLPGTIPPRLPGTARTQFSRNVQPVTRHPPVSRPKTSPRYHSTRGSAPANNFFHFTYLAAGQPGGGAPIPWGRPLQQPPHRCAGAADGLKMPHPVRCPNFHVRKIIFYGKTKKTTHGHTTPRPLGLPILRSSSADQVRPTTRRLTHTRQEPQSHC
jgi:hypothetical protein